MDLSADVSAFVSHLQSIVAHEPPSVRIRAIYFGLFEGLRAKSDWGEVSCPILYVSGSSQSTDDPNWACWDENSWLPETRYFSLPGLSQANPAEWEAIQDAVVALLMEEEPVVARLLGSPEGRPVAVGWDDGEPMVLYVARA